MRLSSLISDGMILQRNQGMRIWGTAETITKSETEVNQSCKVELQFAGNTYRTDTDHNGYWEIELPEMNTGGPYDMCITAKANMEVLGSADIDSIVIKDILIGDVWVLSGQSNMEIPVSRTRDLFGDEIKAADNSNIRMFQVTQQVDFHKPVDDLQEGSWIGVNPESVLNFSAVGYYFAEKMYGQYGVPIGLIQTAIGGAHAEAYMSEEILLKTAEQLRKTHQGSKHASCECDVNGTCKYCYEDVLKRNRDDALVNQIMEEDMKRQNDWFGQLNVSDVGLQEKWYLCGHAKKERAKSIDFTDASWKPMQVPGMWDGMELEHFTGSVWIHRTVNIPKEWVGKETVLWCGTLVEGDDTYVNGIQVGRTEYRYPPRRYQIPADVLHEGENDIMVRIFTHSNVGGFITGHPYCIRCGKDTIDLNGQWEYKIGTSVEPITMDTTFFLWQPIGAYNAMIYPLRRYKIAGVLYYQGEGNDKVPEDYEALMGALIDCWRELFEREDLPFLYVQLANFSGEPMGAANKNDKEGTTWAVVRDGQRKCLTKPMTGGAEDTIDGSKTKRIPRKNVGMASAIDLGSGNELHPQNKKQLGHRLAAWASQILYHETAECCGPLFESAEVEQNENTTLVRVYFTHTGSGLTAGVMRADAFDQPLRFHKESEDTPLRWFQVIDDRGNVYEIVPEIQNCRLGSENVLVADISHIPNPVKLQYAWHNNPEGANLYNIEGYPASSFETYLDKA